MTGAFLFMARTKTLKGNKGGLSLVEQVEVARLYITGEKTIDEIHKKLYPNVDLRTLYRYTENPDNVSRAVDTLHGYVAKTCIQNGKRNPAYMKMLLENIMKKGTPADNAVNNLSGAIMNLARGESK